MPPIAGKEICSRLQQACSVCKSRSPFAASSYMRAKRLGMCLPNCQQRTPRRVLVSSVASCGSSSRQTHSWTGAVRAGRAARQRRLHAVGDLPDMRTPRRLPRLQHLSNAFSAAHGLPPALSQALCIAWRSRATRSWSRWRTTWRCGGPKRAASARHMCALVVGCPCLLLGACVPGTRCRWRWPWRCRPPC